MNKTLKRYCERVDIDKNITCHSFRHMNITKNIEEHGLETTRVLSGHKKTKITEKYNHPNFAFHRKKFYEAAKKKGKDRAEGDMDQEQVNNEMIGIRDGKSDRERQTCQTR